VGPIPGQQRRQVGDLVIGNSGQHVAVALRNVWRSES
jgi:hypothetical protein